MKAAYILVSHDRYFVTKTANKIWEIEDHEIKEFVGTYDEWERWKQERKSAENEASKKKELIVEKKKEEPVQKKSNNNDSINKESQKELQKTQKLFQQLEEKIAKLNKEKTALESDLASPNIYLEKQKFLNAENKYKENSSELQKTNAEYEKLFEKIMELEEKNN